MSGFRTYRKIRKITDTTFGINIPENIAIKYSEINFKVIASGDCIILESGARN